MLNNEPTIDDLKNSIDLVDYVGQHTTLKKSGKEYSGCCPVHGENTPSFYINEEKQTFHCFGCGIGGSIVDFIMSLYSIDTAGAINHLKAHLGIKEGGKLEVVRRLTKVQQEAEKALSEYSVVSIDRANGEIPDACAAMSSLGIFLDSCYSTGEGRLAVPLRSKQAVEDICYPLPTLSRSSYLTNDKHLGYCIAGTYSEHSQHLYLCPDYIDAIYLHKLSEGNNLIIFSPHINYVIEQIKKDYPQREIRLALPNTYQGHKILETFVGRYVMPSEEGYFLEKDRKQTIEGVRYAR